MNSHNPYSTPQADLITSTIHSDGTIGEGSLDKAIQGQYDFRVFDAISEGFTLSNGHKLPINIGMLIIYVLSLIAAFIPFASLLIAGPFTASLEMMGVRAAVGKKTDVGQAFDGFKLFGPLLGLFLLMVLLICIGFVLLVIPGLYLSVAYVFALRVRADKGIPVWESMEASRKAITHRWFPMFGLILMLGLINLLGFVTVIGWIWTIPATYATLGVVYRKMFGVNNTTFTANAA